MFNWASTLARLRDMVKALVLYHSQEFGNTGLMAKAVAEGLRSAGCDVNTWNTDEGRYDVTEFPKYDCVAIGTPDYYSYVAGGLKTFMDDFYVHEVRKGLKGLRDKPYALFYSHGGGGRVKNALGVFKRVGRLIGDPVGCCKAPDEATLMNLRALGVELAEAVKS
jgi:multimeric flavodoxin WrbA